MVHRGVYIVLVVVSSVLITRVTGSDGTTEGPENKFSLKMSKMFDKSMVKDHYPAAWAEIPYKSIVDNDRLFKKYKDCIVAEKPVGCPRMITTIMEMVPEAIATNCGKCLPIHIKKIKEAAEYVCHTRREDYDEVRRARDPTGSIQSSFEKKYGKINC